MHPDRLLDEFAARQYGVFSLTQARSVGFTPKMVETRRANQAWLQLAPSVYCMASAPPKWERQLAAAVLSRDGALVAGRSAAVLHEFPGARPGRPVIMVGEDGNARSALAKVIRTKYLSDVARVRVRGFEVTDEAETILTLARELMHQDLERIVDEVIARGSSDVADLALLIERRSGLVGMKSLRPIVEERLHDAYQPPTSELERHLYALIDHSLVPASTRQMPFSFTTVGATVDLYLPAWRLIVEADGRRWHTRKADMERDRRRDNEAAAHGFVVLRFTWEMLTKTPGDCLDLLLRTGRVRSTA